MLSSSSFQAGYRAIHCPPNLETIRLGKHETFTALPTAEIHGIAESKAEFTIAIAIGVLKPMPFLLYAQLVKCTDLQLPRRLTAQLQLAVGVLEHKAIPPKSQELRLYILQ